MSETYSFLRKVPLFADLRDEDLEQICQHVQEVRLRPGEILFEEGEPGKYAYLIKEGLIEIYKEAGGHDVQLSIRQAGEVIGEMSLVESAPRSASGRAVTDVLLLALSQEAFDRLLDSSPSATRAMLHTVTSRLRSTQLSLNQSEKMAQLGTLTAGIAHELNNPSSAVMRGALQFKESFAGYQNETMRLAVQGFTGEQLQGLQELVSQDNRPRSVLDPVRRNDRESEFEDWLDDLGIENGWELAPILAETGYKPEEIKTALEGISPANLPLALQWIAHSVNLNALLDEINQGANRISEIVRALKSYVYLDQAPVQAVSVEEGLENTLVILRHKLKQGVEIAREYDPAVPPIQAYGSELNQVWTNIIDNAIDAMDGKGKIRIHTHLQDPWVVVDISDTGPGIPPEIQPKLFSPFFTTKPLGKGTGLGLNISYNIVQKHGGEIKVNSRPGETHFTVSLPVDFKQIKEGSRALQSVRRSDDDRLRHILQEARAIAVVGISDEPERAAYSVPAYLQEQGYRILPVNPRLDGVLGEKAYPDLVSIPVPVDLVLIFRASEVVPAIVDQAIAIHAKAVWMQEGISNEAAAQAAEQAGLEVVMNTCMRSTHRRLFSGQPAGQRPAGKGD